MTSKSHTYKLSKSLYFAVLFCGTAFCFISRKEIVMINSELIVDNFAGGGGASTGIELATGRSVDIAINHDPYAILMHKTNHPNTKHYCESVWDVNPTEICAGHSVGLMWLSPDCKHFSRAKGGKPVDKNVRGLAWIALRWAATVRPRVIILENVPEFVTWGRLGKDGKPDKRYTGETFRSFVYQLRQKGYDVDWRELKACDYGAPTIRKRFFLIARCDGKPIVFPKPTHGEGEGLLPYRTAAECIDWSITCQSIFERKKPLADNTLRRIAKGLDKFTIKAKKPFIMVNNYVPSVQKYYGGIIGSDVAEPLGTVTAVDHNALMAANLIQYHSEQSDSEVRGQEVDKPIMTVDMSNRYGLAAAHIVKYYSGDSYSSVNDPLHTITVKERNALVESHLCVLRNNMDCKPLTEPLPTECTSGGHFAEIRTRIVKYGHGKGIFPSYLNQFSKLLITTLFQILVFKLGMCLALTSNILEGNLVQIIWAIACLMLVHGIPTIMQEFMVPRNQGGGAMAKVYSVGMMANLIRSVAK